MILLRAEMICLFKVTAREKASLARRLPCAFGRVALLFAVLLLVGYVAFTHRYAIEAKVWHWRHGYLTTVRNYEIPVPTHWLIFAQEDESLTMVNTSSNPPSDDKSYAAPIVTVDVGLLSQVKASGNSDLMGTWASLECKWLADNKVEGVVDDTRNLANESVSCIGGNKLDAILRDKLNLRRTRVVSLDCMSARGLKVTFFGEPSDIQSFYELLSQIRRRN